MRRGGGDRIDAMSKIHFISFAFKVNNFKGEKIIEYKNFK